MPFYAVHYAYSSDSAALDAVRPTHRTYLASLVDGGALRASGPYVGTDPSALLLFVADSKETVRTLLDQDPFQVAGLVERTEITEWNPIIGAFAHEV